MDLAVSSSAITASPPGRFLFPNYRTGEEGLATDWRSAIDAVAAHAGWRRGGVRSKVFRHTYCAARLQTMDHGAPVSVYTVAKEMGHGGEWMVRNVFGHLGHPESRNESLPIGRFAARRAGSVRPYSARPCASSTCSLPIA